MASVWVQALLVVCVVGVTFAWRHPGYYMSRRDAFCSQTGDICLENAHCCNFPAKDVCATPYNGGGRGTARCKARYEVQKGFKPSLEDGAECKSSGQCRSGCCREMTRGRFARNYVCGPVSSDVLCADYNKATYLDNEIIDY